MKVDEMTIGEVKELRALFGGGCAAPELQPFGIGKAYLIRTVTNYWTGRIVSVGKQELVIEDAAWIADTGRFHEAVAKGLPNEVEPVDGPVIVGRGSIVDAVEWRKELPRCAK